MFPWVAALATSAAVACGDGGGGGDGADAAASDARATSPDATSIDAGRPDATPRPDAAPIDVACDDLPDGPFELVPLGGQITASEDLAFDDAGHLVGSNDDVIFKSRRDGTRTFFADLDFRAALRYTSRGDLVVNDNNRNRLVRIDTDGVVHEVLSGLAYPNGLAADRNGFVYVTEQDANRIRRVDPLTGDFIVLSNGQIEAPNGISFNETYTALYIGGFSGVGTIYKLPVDADGNTGPLTEFATGIGTGSLDGIAVDACGNVYIADFGASEIWRISPDGTDKRVVIRGADEFVYLPNMQWGSGLGGWDANKLYIPEGWTHGVFEVDVGVPGKPRVFP